MLNREVRIILIVGFLLLLVLLILLVVVDGKRAWGRVDRIPQARGWLAWWARRYVERAQGVQVEDAVR